MNKLRFYNIWITLGIVYTVLIMVVSFLPLDGPETISHIDKVVHFLIYFIHAFSFLQISKRIKTILIVGIILGISIEILQPIISTRFFDYFDILANILGSVTGGLLALKYNRVVLYIEKRILS